LKAVARWVRFSVFARSLLIQGSWNFRTMMGGGFAFALLPFLRRLFVDDPEALRAALQRHTEHFNAHPYMAGAALGAVCRMEEDGRDPEGIARFKRAVRGPLGGLGDVLVWVGWRPLTVLAALVLALVGVSPVLTVVCFLVLYNAGHLALRIWCFRVGLQKGSHVGDPLRRMALPLQADRLAAVGVFLLGGLVGLLVHQGWLLGGWALTLLCGTGGVWGLWLGGLVGQRGWKWSIWGTSIIITSLLVFGWIA
jgi:PTS system mannose-specific IID component